MNAVANKTDTPIRFLRLPQVKDRTGLSTSATYADGAAGTFPKPLKIGPNTSAWLEHEVDAVVRARARGDSKEQIQQLVSEMVAKRGAL
jgi:prophage regulatory protein